MTLALNEECKVRLRNALAVGLKDVQVRHGMFLDQDSLIALLPAEPVLPQHGAARERLNYIFDELPLVDFVSGTISRELSELDEYKADVEREPLVAIQSFSDTAALAERLVAQFDSLPWQYTLTFKLPEPLSSLFEVERPGYDLDPQTRIARPIAGFGEQYPLQPLSERHLKRIYGAGSLLIGPRVPEWQDGRIYFQTQFDGFVGAYGLSLTSDGAKRRLKSFFGLGLALRVFRISRNYMPSQPKLECLFHRMVDKKWVIDSRLELTETESEAFSSIELHDLDGQLDDDKKRLSWAQRGLHKIHKTLSAGEDAEGLLLASQWLFDSYTGKDELLNYVQAMVVLEILLGDKASADQIGLGELLRNRCAYLIGTTAKQREKILHDFKAIYQVRSQIVHRGKHRLSLRDRSLFATLQWYCRRVIQEEVDLRAGDQE